MSNTHLFFFLSAFIKKYKTVILLDNDAPNDPFVTGGSMRARAGTSVSGIQVSGGPCLRDPSLRGPSLRGPSVRGIFFIYKYQYVTHYPTLKDSGWLL